MTQLSAATLQQLDRLSHSSKEVCASLLAVAFQSFSHAAAETCDIKLPSGISDGDEAGAVTALAELIAKSIRQNLTSDQFLETLATLNISSSSTEQVAQMFGETKAALHPVISSMSCTSSSAAKLRHMDWRIELEVHKKNLRNVYTPVVLMKFWLDGKESSEDGVVRMRVCDVHHMRDVLEEALIEAKSHKIERQVRKWL